MIQPEDIRRKAENLYRDYLLAWLTGETFFPRDIPARKVPDPADLAGAAEDIQRLRRGSKELLGSGYTVEWREVRSRALGRNTIPARVLFETSVDFLHFIGKDREFAAFEQTVNRLRATVPALEPWIRSNVTRVAELAPDLEGLIGVLLFLSANPRPQLFARELPIRADTKLVERRQGLLREWLDLLLPPHAIRADEEHFERRYGLRYAEPHFHVRLLDPLLAKELGFPCSEFSLPLGTLAGLPVREAEVVIVENKVNLLTLPPSHRGFGLGGLGHGVTQLRYCPWITNLPVTYWGDLDVEGFEILSSLRTLFPQARSIFMDETTLDDWRHLATRGTGRQPDRPPRLTETEGDAYLRCRNENLRLEQERIPQAIVLAVLHRLESGN